MVLGYLALGVLLMVGLAALLRWFASADPAALARGVIWVGVVLAVVGVVVLVLFGRIGLLPLVFSVLLPLFLRWQAVRRRASGPSAAGGGPTSRVDTAWLGMELDHASGTLAGEVRAGRFAGRALADLSLDDLLDLLAECRRSDPDSIAVLEAYLDRAHPAAWRERMAAREGAAGDGARTSRGPMTREEAYEILGLAPGASEEEIKEAHRRLMQKIHPDHGGSTYLAAQINRAKDLLLGA